MDKTNYGVVFETQKLFLLFLYHSFTVNEETSILGLTFFFFFFFTTKEVIELDSLHFD